MFLNKKKKKKNKTKKQFLEILRKMYKTYEYG